MSYVTQTYAYVPFGITFFKKTSRLVNRQRIGKKFSVYNYLASVTYADAQALDGLHNVKRNLLFVKAYGASFPLEVNLLQAN